MKLNKNNFALSSFSMDLKRVALGLHRKSYAMAERFIDEAEKRSDEIAADQLPHYIQMVLKKAKNALHDTDSERVPEDLMMYSQLIQNYLTSS